MATDFDPYRILGVGRTASSADVRAAYERLIAETPEESGQRREVEAAYSVLGNAESRREYDSRLSAREVLGVTPVPRDALAQPEQPAGEVPWTMGDISKALILPLILIALNIIAAFSTDIETDELSETDHIIGFGFGFLLEVALLALAYHFAVRKYKGSLRSLGFRWPPDLKWWFPLSVLGGAFASIWIWVGVLYLLGAEPESNIPENAYDYVIPVIMLGILSILVAPVVEEVFFRAFLFQGAAKQWGMWGGVAFSAFIFGLAHVGAPDSLLVVPAIMLIGAIFAWGFGRSGSIYPSLFAHVVFNTVSFVVGFTE